MSDFQDISTIKPKMTLTAKFRCNCCFDSEKSITLDYVDEPSKNLEAMHEELRSARWNVVPRTNKTENSNEYTYICDSCMSTWKAVNKVMDVCTIGINTIPEMRSINQAMFDEARICVEESNNCGIISTSFTNTVAYIALVISRYVVYDELLIVDEVYKFIADTFAPNRKVK